MLRFLAIPLQSIAMKWKVFTDLSEYDEVKIIRDQIPDITKEKPTFNKHYHLATERQQATPMYSTQLCIVHRWLLATKPYFVDIQKKWSLLT